MKKLNKNTVLLKESELQQLIENVVRQSLIEEGNFDKGKTLRNIGLGALGAASVYGAGSIDDGDHGQSGDEMQHEINKGVEVDGRPMYSHNDSIDDEHTYRHDDWDYDETGRMHHMGESYDLTQSQFRQILRESVYQILQENGVRIDEAPNIGQKFMAGLQNVKHLPWHWKKYYNQSLANSEAQKADKIATRQRKEMQDLSKDYLKKYQDALSSEGAKTGGFLGLGQHTITKDDAQKNADKIKQEWERKYKENYNKNNIAWQEANTSSQQYQNKAKKANTNGTKMSYDKPTNYFWDGNIDWDGSRIDALRKKSAQTTKANNKLKDTKEKYKIEQSQLNADLKRKGWQRVKSEDKNGIAAYAYQGNPNEIAYYDPKAKQMLFYDDFGNVRRENV